MLLGEGRGGDPLQAGELGADTRVVAHGAFAVAGQAVDGLCRLIIFGSFSLAGMTGPQEDLQEWVIRVSMCCRRLRRGQRGSKATPLMVTRL